jgi:hypothetical protein
MVTQKLFKNAVPTIFRLPTGPTEDSAVLDLDLSSQVLFGDSAVLDLDRSSRMTVIIWLFPLLGHSSRSITAAHHGKKKSKVYQSEHVSPGLPDRVLHLSLQHREHPTRPVGCRNAANILELPSVCQVLRQLSQIFLCHL